MWIWKLAAFRIWPHLYILWYKFKHHTVHYYRDLFIWNWVVATFEIIFLSPALFVNGDINKVNKMKITVYPNIHSDVGREVYLMLIMGWGRINGSGCNAQWQFVYQFDRVMPIWDKKPICGTCICPSYKLLIIYIFNILYWYQYINIQLVIFLISYIGIYIPTLAELREWVCGGM